MSDSSSKRTQLEVLADILELCRKPTAKTKIMYKTNLSYQVMQKSVNQLLKLKLLIFDPKAKKFQASPKGLEFLQRYSALIALLNS